MLSELEKRMFATAPISPRDIHRDDPEMIAWIDAANREMAEVRAATAALKPEWLKSDQAK